MFKKIALVAMLAAGSLQASKTEQVTAFVKAIPSTVKNATLSKYFLNADRKMSSEITKKNGAAVTLNAVNAVSRIALLTQVIRAGLAAKKADKGEKVDAAKKVLTSKTTIAAAVAAVAAVVCPKGYNWYSKPAKKD